MSITGLGWFNLGWLLLDLAIVTVLILTVLLQRRESGATLSWIMVILLVPFLGLLAFWLFGTTRLSLQVSCPKLVDLLQPSIGALWQYHLLG